MKSIRPRGLWKSHFDDTTVAPHGGGGGRVVMKGREGRRNDTGCRNYM